MTIAIVLGLVLIIGGVYAAYRKGLRKPPNGSGGAGSGGRDTNRTEKH